jgi:vitamin B12 transporter
MKSPKGFRGRYFSLAAILAFSATVTLANQTQSVVETKKEIQKQEELDDKEELTPSAEELDVVVVSKKIKTKQSKVYSASKNYVSKTNITDNVNILTSEEIELQGITTVKDALNSLPGITVTTSGGLGQTSSVFVQGLSNKYLLVLVDGVRYNDPTNTSSVELTNLLVNDIEKIEVIKGAQSGIWGADAAAGVVNIITKKAEAGTHGNIGIELGSYNHKSFNTSLSHRTTEYDVIMSLFRVTEDGFSAVLPKGDDLDKYEDDSYRNTTFNLKTGYWLNSDNRLEFGYHDINSLVHFDDFDWMGNPLPNADKGTDYRGKSAYLKYKYFVGKHNVEVTLTQNNFHNKQLNATFGVEDSVGQTPSFELKDTYKYGKDSNLVVGSSYEDRKIAYTQVGSSEEKEKDNAKAIFLNNTYRYNDIVLSQALRYDSFSSYKNKLTGKIGAKYLFNNDVNIYANYGTAYKSPNIMDMINIWGISNYDLKPENIKSFNIGFEYFGLHVNAFRNEIDDMISWDGVTSKNINKEGTSTFKGVEISYQKIFFNKLLFGANYTYVDAKEPDGTRLLRRPRYEIGTNLSYEASKKFMLSADASYIGSRADSDFSTSPATPVDTGRYLLVNTKFDYNINKTFSTYLKVNNILDKEYQSVYGYATPRRSYYVGFNAKF